MISKLLNGKRKIKLHELVSEYSYTQVRCNVFLRRYIFIISISILTILWINSEFNTYDHWTYYFPVKSHKITRVESVSVPQPFGRDEIIDYARSFAYELFSVTPKTYKRHFNDIFTNKIIGKSYIELNFKAIKESGMLNRLKSGWYFSLENVGSPSVKMGLIHGHNAWRVKFNNIIVYGIKNKEISKVKGDLAVWIKKTDYMNSPSQLSVIKVFLSNMNDVGNQYGY